MLFIIILENVYIFGIQNPTKALQWQRTQDAELGKMLKEFAGF